MQFDGISKNLFRKYPLVSTSQDFNTAWIVDMALTAPYGYTGLYIQSIVVKAGWVSVAVGRQGFGLQGYFKAKVTSGFQTVEFDQVDPWVGGWLQVGDTQSFLADQSLSLDFAGGRLEPSVVTRYKRPALQGLQVGPTFVTGNISFVSTRTCTIEKDGADVTALVLPLASVSSKQDLDSSLGNCGTPLVYGVGAQVPDNAGAVNFVGVIPVSFDVEPGALDIVVNTDDVKLQQICGYTHPRPALNPPYLTNPQPRVEYYSMYKVPQLAPVGENIPEYTLWQ